MLTFALHTNDTLVVKVNTPGTTAANIQSGQVFYHYLGPSHLTEGISMANASSIVFTEGAATTLPSPAAGGGATFVDTSDHLNVLNSAGKLWVPSLNSATRAQSGTGINTTETVITQAMVVPVGLLQVGTLIRVQGSGTCTATAGNLSTWTLRAGTLGTTSDQAIVTATATSATSGTNIAFNFDLVVAVDAVGATGTCKGYFILNNTATTGVATAAYTRVQLSGTNLATTTATNIEVSYKTAATTTTSTYDAAVTLAR